MRSLAAASVLLLVLAAGLAAPLPGGATSTTGDPYEVALQRALAYLADGAPDGNEYLVEAVVGAGLDPGLWPTPEANILDPLSIPAPGAFNDPIREIHAVAQSGYDARDFQGRDLVADLKDAWGPTSQGVGQAAFTLLGLHAAGVPRGDEVLEEAILRLRQSQSANGGWSCWGLPSPDCTGFALTALASEDALLPGMADRARIWLDSNRLPNGGYASGGHIGPLTVAGVSVLDAEGANSQSTIWAVHSYRAIGDPAPEPVMAYLLGRQMPDGGFAWRDGDTASDRWATMEVVAGWRRSFHGLPVYVDASPVAPSTVPVGVDATFQVDGFADVVWRDLSSPDTALVGPAVDLRFTTPGTHEVHVEATRGGAHHRERLATTAANAAPAFLDLPSEVTVHRHDEVGLEPGTSDPDGHAVTVSWTFQGQSGTGTVDAVAKDRGTHVLELEAGDPYGATTTASVLVHVVNPAGR